MISGWWCINFNWNWLINFMALRQGDGWKIITYMRLENMSLGQLKIRECQVTWGGLCNILASQQSSEQNFWHFHLLVHYFPGFLVFFKRPAQILPQDRKINGFKGCTVFARVTQKGWWQTDRWRKVTVFLGLRRRGHRRPRPTERVCPVRTTGGLVVAWVH